MKWPSLLNMSRDFFRKRRSNSLWRVCFIVTSVVVFVYLMIIRRRDSSHYYPESFLRSLVGPVLYDDLQLIQYIRNEVLEPPSLKPYNFTYHVRDKMSVPSSVNFYSNYTRKIFNFTEPGFFVEAGALDGQSMSNTLWLEREKGWTGLLVEPDPVNYKALKFKNRKAWTAKACLAMDTYPKMEKLSSYHTERIEGYFDMKNKAMGSILRPEIVRTITDSILYKSYYYRQCFPLGSMLLALNVTKIDLLSLDVEFIEEYVIKNFDFDKFDVQVLYMEWWKLTKEGQWWVHQYLTQKKFVFIANFPGNIIYIKNGTEYLSIMDRIHPLRVHKFYDLTDK